LTPERRILKQTADVSVTQTHCRLLERNLGAKHGQAHQKQLQCVLQKIGGERTLSKLAKTSMMVPMLENRSKSTRKNGFHVIPLDEKIGHDENW
jgi:hypothetical protein